MTKLEQAIAYCEDNIREIDEVISEYSAGAAGEAGGRKRKMSEIDARTKAIGIISGGRVQALEDAGLMIVDKQEIDRLKEKLNAVLQDFYQYVQGGKEICAFCLHDYECEPGETICGATYKGFKWRGLNEREDL
jgi:uncharacterized coiled-coil protein SlyX